MASLQISRWYIIAIVLLANVDQIRPLNPNRNLEGNSGDVIAFEDSVFPETLSKELADSFNRKISNALDEITDNIKSRYGYIGSADIFDIVFNLFLANNEERFRKLEEKILEFGTDVEAIVKLINLEIGSNVIRIVDNSIFLDANVLSNLFQRSISNLLTYEFPDNLFLQLSLTKLAQDEIRKVVPTLQTFFEESKIQLRDVQKIMAATSVGRSKRDLSSILDTILEVIRVPLRLILSPIQQIINSILNSVSDFVVSLYVTDEPNNSLFQFILSITNPAVLKVAEVILNIEDFFNGIFNEILYGNGTSTTTATSATAATSATTGTQSPTTTPASSDVAKSLYSIGLRDSTNDTDDSFFSSIQNFISNISVGINSFIKEFFLNFLNNIYPTIGQFISYPLRYVVELVVNTIFSCGNNCTSIL